MRSTIIVLSFLLLFSLVACSNPYIDGKQRAHERTYDFELINGQMYCLGDYQVVFIRYSGYSKMSLEHDPDYPKHYQYELKALVLLGNRETVEQDDGWNQSRYYHVPRSAVSTIDNC